MDIEKIIAENQCTIVDVRSYGEFLGGNVAGSINIPLNEIPERIEELKNNEELFAPYPLQSKFMGLLKAYPATSNSNPDFKSYWAGQSASLLKLLI